MVLRLPFSTTVDVAAQRLPGVATANWRYGSRTCRDCAGMSRL